MWLEFVIERRRTLLAAAGVAGTDGRNRIEAYVELRPYSTIRTVQLALAAHDGGRWLGLADPTGGGNRCRRKPVNLRKRTLSNTYHLLGRYPHPVFDAFCEVSSFPNNKTFDSQADQP